MLLEQLLASLFENEVLNDETKAQLEEAIETMLKEAKDTAKSDAEKEIRAELTAQFIKDKEELVEALDTKAEEFLNSEIDELKEDIERFRDLEVEYSERLVEARQEMAATVASDLEELVEALDTFVEMRLRTEMAEFADSIEEVKKINHGKQMFEAFENIYLTNFSDESSTAAKLDETASKLSKTTTMLEEATAKLDAVKRASTMVEVLSDLTGRPKELMEAILKSVPTDQLEEGYDNFISRVLHESADAIVEEKAEKETGKKVLAENDVSTKEGDKFKDSVVVVSGDSQVSESVEVEEKNARVLSESAIYELQKLAGIKY